MNMSVENGDYFYMNSSAGSVIKNHNSVDYISKRGEMSTSIYWWENNSFPDCVDIDDILPASTTNKCVNVEYNNEHSNIQINGNIST